MSSRVAGMGTACATVNMHKRYRTSGIGRRKMLSPGTKVIDRITGTATTIVQAIQRDGVTYYQLAVVPISPAYPDGWRHDGEVIPN